MKLSKVFCPGSNSTNAHCVYHDAGHCTRFCLFLHLGWSGQGVESMELGAGSSRPSPGRFGQTAKHCGDFVRLLVVTTIPISIQVSSLADHRQQTYDFVHRPFGHPIKV
jgi:hypothetical protein